MKKTPLEINIRKMTLDDLEQVHQIDKQSFANPWPKKSFKFELEENDAARCWVAEVTEGEHAKVVGAAVSWLLVDQAHIATVAVEESYRRQRIAYRLICTSLVEMQKEGAASATLEVRAGNRPAQALYRKFGFQLVGRRPGYYKDNGEDAILMTLVTLDEDHLKNIRCLPW